MTFFKANASFEDTVMPHLDAAYNLARWMTRNPDDAHDVVQESLVRALKYFSGFRGGDGRSWFLTIVRNSCYTFFQRRSHKAEEPLETDLMAEQHQHGPEGAAINQAQREKIQQALADLPAEYREVTVLRELEDLSYKEISAIVGVPMGTVMSRLARARQRLQLTLAELRNPQ